MKKEAPVMIFMTLLMIIGIIGTVLLVRVTDKQDQAPACIYRVASLYTASKTEAGHIYDQCLTNGMRSRYGDKDTWFETFNAKWGIDTASTAEVAYTADDGENRWIAHIILIPSNPSALYSRLVVYTDADGKITFIVR